MFSQGLLVLNPDFDACNRRIRTINDSALEKVFNTWFKLYQSDEVERSMTVRKTIDPLRKIREPLRMFLLVGFLLLAVDCASPRTDGAMVLRFAFFTILALRPKLEAFSYLSFLQHVH